VPSGGESCLTYSGVERRLLAGRVMADSLLLGSRSLMLGTVGSEASHTSVGGRPWVLHLVAEYLIYLNKYCGIAVEKGLPRASPDCAVSSSGSFSIDRLVR